MFNIVKTFKLAVTGLLTAAAISVTAFADILIIDDERVEREAAAYKDFNLQTGSIRESIVALRNRLARGGTFEQGLADLEKRKALIGNDKYEEERQTLAQNYEVETQQLARLELAFDRLLQDAQAQVERARAPVVRQILKDRGAKIIMMKRLVMGSAAGIDVTTEFIEQLDAQLPSVTLALLQQQQTQQGDAVAPASEGGQ